MQYERQREKIWLRLQDPNAPQSRHAVTSREAFDGVCAAFIQAELGPGMDEDAVRWGRHRGCTVDDIKTYRAEWNVWAYYYGEHDPFPGIDPALQHSLPRQTDTYIPSYSQISSHSHSTFSQTSLSHSTPNRKIDIGPILRGRAANERRRAEKQKDRGMRAIERRAEEAKKFMENRKSKEMERRERRKIEERGGLEGGSSGRDGGEDDRGERYFEGGGSARKGGWYTEGGDDDHSVGFGTSGYKRWGRSMSPREGTSDDWRGYERAERYELFGRQRDLSTARDERGRRQNHGRDHHRERFESGRLGEDDGQPGYGGGVWAASGWGDNDGSSYHDRDERRRDRDVGGRRHPPSLRREDGGQLVEDTGNSQTSTWTSGTQPQSRIQGEDQAEGDGPKDAEPRECHIRDRRDRGFEILEDERDNYRQGRKRYREH